MVRAPWLACLLVLPFDSAMANPRSKRERRPGPGLFAPPTAILGLGNGIGKPVAAGAVEHFAIVPAAPMIVHKLVVGPEFLDAFDVLDLTVGDESTLPFETVGGEKSVLARAFAQEVAPMLKPRKALPSQRIELAVRNRTGSPHDFRAWILAEFARERSPLLR